MHSDAGEVLDSSQLNFLRVKVQIDPRLPLIQNIRIRLDNGVVRSEECKYERVFKSCSACHRIGHMVNACPHSAAQMNEGFDQVATRTFNKFGTRFLCSFTARAAELVWQDWIRAHRTRGSTRIRFNRHNLRYFVFEALPQDVLLNSDRFEGILHFSDDDTSDEDSPTSQATPDAPPSAENTDPIHIEEDAEEGQQSPIRNDGPNVADESQGDPNYLAYLQTLAPLDTLVDHVTLVVPKNSPPSNDLNNPIVILDDPGTELSLQPSHDSAIGANDQDLNSNQMPISYDQTLVVADQSEFLPTKEELENFTLVLSSLNVDCPALELAFGKFISACILGHAKSVEDSGNPPSFSPLIPMASARASD